jgi:hypothetical protein
MHSFPPYSFINPHAQGVSIAIPDSWKVYSSIRIVFVEAENITDMGGEGPARPMLAGPG